MKALIDFIPLVLFFLAYKQYDIYIATLVIMIATSMQAFVFYLLYKKIDKQLAISLGLILVFGALTLLFKNDTFLKFKVSIVYFVFALILVVTNLQKKNLLEKLMSKEITLDYRTWQNLSYIWAIFFSFCAFLNLYIAYNFSQEFWVQMKVFGFSLLTLAGLILTIIFIVIKNKKKQN